jgi:hypothetical protein
VTLLSLQDSSNLATGCVYGEVTNGTGRVNVAVCDGTDTCQNGICSAGTPSDSDDAEPRTIDSCGLATRCHNLAIQGCCASDADCTDSSACTINVRPVESTCTGGTA